MPNNEILICGAGIAGPALAYWLRKRGFTVTIVERAPAPRPGGQTVDLRGAGRTVIERMGLMDRARAESVDQRGLALVDAAGRTTARVPAESFGGEGIVSEIEILRGDLARLLYESTLPDTEYLFDDTVTGIAQDADGVTVAFEKAAPRRFGLVVGADGPHSVVRALAFGPEPEFVHPLGLYTAWFTATDDLDLDGWYLMHNAPGGLVASARPGRVPGEIKAGLSFRSAPIDYDRRDIAAQQVLVAERFAEVGWEAPRLLRAMRTAPDFFFDSMGQVRLDRWSRGRVALLGDAGYCATPLTGLGTSLALVGAYVLAGEIAAAKGDHRIAFRKYDEVMRPYVSQAQQLPPGGASGFAPSGRLGIRLRDLSMRQMTRWPMRNLLAAQFAKAGDIALPKYGFAAAIR
ncbi:2-polyprenyl-6-methoxyphenol hydroxylase-like FAD-dependent oxidoreductase [Streptomyces griseochromogenes]|uniref:2-polyprenyl-6-methoxyphenol hydroxylase-like FAD-dependent oxidoreductase n=1 Tax=Streptomyces griseochromogenes TaxID=68214 RepID=A0A1B1BCY5_9ACTN|nr:FAD-dependent monooxygenase [Streptomyces griseochromogenes]ANP56609.1 FAD-binding monooxygenase [Streptomyces griseochromogenes]MBP2049868.1 2-polyprenyl-6-methoxyphenol hydroxylase-like FAD-dependent oxidoreductase [Streptomyces griseochromogenes]